MSDSRLDAYGRLRWGLVTVDGTTVYWEETVGSGLRAREYGAVNAPWHKVSETVNKKVWDAIEAARKHDHSKGVKGE